MRLQQKIEAYINDIDASFGIHIKNLKTKEEVHVQSDRLFQMASVFKVPILAKLYEKVYQGEIDLNDRIEIRKEDLVPGSGVLKEMDPGIKPSIKDLATMMIIVSDNLATDKILSLVGAKNVQEEMREIGINKLYIEHSCWDLLRLSVGLPDEPFSKKAFNEIMRRLRAGEYNWDSIVFQENTNNNLSTPKDMSLLLEKIALGEYVSEACSKDIVDILLRQQHRQRIQGALPRGIKVASKTGSLGTMFNDAGIVYLPNNKGLFVITVYSIGKTLEYKGNEPIAHIAQMAYESFIEN